MRKSIWIFLLAVLLPSVVLGWLALRSAEEQKIILERRTAELYQQEADNVAAAARAAIEEERRAFAEVVRKLLAGEDPRKLAATFTDTLAATWSRQAVGFAIGPNGLIVSPLPPPVNGMPEKPQKPELKKFLLENGAFLSGSMAATVYPVPVDDLNRPEQMRKRAGNYANDNKAGGYGGKLEDNKPQKAGPGAGAKEPLKEFSEPPSQVAQAAPEPTARRDKSSAVQNLDAPQMASARGDLAVNERPNSLGSTASVAKSKQSLENELAGQGKDLRPSAPPVSAAAPAPTSPTQTEAALSPLNRQVILKQKLNAPGEASNTVTEKQDRQSTRRPNSPSAPSTPEEAVGGVMGKVLGERDKLADQDEERREAPLRNVLPQQMLDDLERAPASNLWSAKTEFRALVTDRDEGMVTRFVQDRLDMIFWLRPAQAPDLIFGCLIQAENLQDVWPSTMPNPDYRTSLSTDNSEFILALLDDKARPVLTQPAVISGPDWKRPFVAAEIGEALPHWEAALYLRRPEQLQESARGVRRTLLLLIVSMLGAIACGGWLVVNDARRQLVLAQQKTDFVSNVSHELKTPLTSIRMFAELMQNGRAETASKAPQYLRIIMVEAERLTRLINNVLDFATIERRQKRFEKKPLDLHAVIERTWEAHELHLQGAGFSTQAEMAAGPYPVFGDEDALAQILVNLLSNAEKYAGAQKEVGLHSYLDGGSAWVSVLDRGSGVVAGEELKIFEAFYRAHDSLSSGIQGSGLGLTLALRLAKEHGGEIRYEARPDGGSRFTLRVPLRPSRSEGPC